MHMKHGCEYLFKTMLLSAAGWSKLAWSKSPNLGYAQFDDCILCKRQWCFNGQNDQLVSNSGYVKSSNKNHSHALMGEVDQELRLLELGV